VISISTAILFTPESTFATTPPRLCRFVENKSQSAIRPTGDRPVETSFSPFSDLKSIIKNRACGEMKFTKK
jgi:hypothetical protein